MFQGRTIFSSYANATSAAHDFVGRIHRLEDAAGYGQGSVNLTNIRDSDQGWYECKVIFPNRTPSSRNNGTWSHLSIDGKSRMYSKIAPNSITSHFSYFFPSILLFQDREEQRIE